MIQNTSFDSLTTSQIFQTYQEENEGESPKYSHLLVDQEIDMIRQNLNMPTVETEEDEKEEMRSCRQIQSDLRDFERSDEDFEGLGYKVVGGPLQRRVVMMEYDEQADIAEAKH